MKNLISKHQRGIILSSIIILASSINSYSQVTSYGTGAGTSGIDNSNFGYYAGHLTPSGSQNNTFIGYYSGYNNLAYDNTFVGYTAGANNTNGYYNLFVGANAGHHNQTGADNTFLGEEAGYLNSRGSRNIFVGGKAGKNNIASDNFFAGYKSGLANTSGYANLFVGNEASINNTTGSYNVSIGQSAGRNITTGTNNVSIGVAAGGGFFDYEVGGVTTTHGNLFMGNNAGRKSSLTQGYNIVLGYAAGHDHTFPTNSSIFLVNNQAFMNNPMLYGKFADNSDHYNPVSSATSGASLAINTSILQPDMTLTVNGRICVGDFSDGHTKTQPSTTSLQNYSLWVEKGVVANNFAVVDVADWADHVFNVDYELMPLSDVANYIQKNNHLPNIPSENDLKKDGYDIHGMNKKFMTKIEELTLYTIAQEKKIDDQQAKIDALNTALEDYKQLAQQLQELKDMIDNNNKQ